MSAVISGRRRYRLSRFRWVTVSSAMFTDRQSQLGEVPEESERITWLFEALILERNGIGNLVVDG
ncbi:hypothetical protein BN978_03576 [Mycolicibacterium mageritense DSM 44476 = CIP 104973]|nr:hypothetical protein BN978_03576 [Mycolicibacterium mageritense DSM 44476 = CIP 104973]